MISKKLTRHSKSPLPHFKPDPLKYPEEHIILPSKTSHKNNKRSKSPHKKVVRRSHSKSRGGGPDLGTDLWIDSAPSYYYQGQDPNTTAISVDGRVNEYQFGRTDPAGNFIVASGVDVINPANVKLTGGKRRRRRHSKSTASKKRSTASKKKSTKKRTSKKKSTINKIKDTSKKVYKGTKNTTKKIIKKTKNTTSSLFSKLKALLSRKKTN